LLAHPAVLELFPRGAPAFAALQAVGCMAERYEATNSEALGEAFGRQCLFHQGVIEPFKSALFNKEQCWLLETLFGRPLRLLKMRWDTPGSARELQRFLGAPAAPPLLQLLWRVLAHQRLATLAIAGRCHIGCGAKAHVFDVHHASDAARTPLAARRQRLVPRSCSVKFSCASQCQGVACAPRTANTSTSPPNPPSRRAPKPMPSSAHSAARYLSCTARGGLKYRLCPAA
jgi:hypothetical protein